MPGMAWQMCWIIKHHFYAVSTAECIFLGPCQRECLPEIVRELKGVVRNFTVHVEQLARMDEDTRMVEDTKVVEDTRMVEDTRVVEDTRMVKEMSENGSWQVVEIKLVDHRESMRNIEGVYCECS